ncbi:MAG: hypothetical protein ACI4RI_05155, partial [Ruminococcus sp.]
KSTSSREMCKCVSIDKGTLERTMVNFTKNATPRSYIRKDNTSNNNPLSEKAVLNTIKEFNVHYKYINGVLYYDNTPFTNIWVEIVACIKPEEESRSMYKCNIIIKGQIKNKDIPIKSFIQGKWAYEIPGFAILCDKAKGTNLLFQYLNALTNSFTPNQSIGEYITPGWRNINNSFVYLTKNGIIGKTDFNAYSEHGQQIVSSTVNMSNAFRDYFEMINLTKASSTSAIIILYLSMSLCHTLFRKAGLTPKFILFLNGRRGSYKTSLAIAMTQFDSNEAIYNLKSTAAGIETGFKEYKDSVMLIDDLYPTTLVPNSNEMKSKLELVVRAFGDGTGKKRNYDFLDTGKKPMQYKAEGGAIITGEYVTGCESSLARCLFLDLNSKVVNLALLSKLQNDKGILSNYAYAFIVALSELMNNEGIDVIGFIKDKGQYYRNNLSGKFSNGRYSEYYGQLRATLDLLMYVANRYHLLTFEEIQYYNEIFLKAIDEVIQSNNKRLINNSPLTILCDSIIDSIENGKCAPKQLGEHIQITNNNILEDVNNYYITQSYCCRIFKDYIKENNIQTPEISSTEVGNLLLKAKIIPEFQEGKTIRKAVKMSGYGSIRFMHINKQKLIEESSQARR